MLVASERYDSLIRYYWDRQMAALKLSDSPSWYLPKAMILHESNFNPQAVSRAGAYGLMQLMPATAAAVGVQNRFNPEQSIRGGIEYLVRCWKIFRAESGLERWWFAVGSYNTGPGNVIRAQDLTKEDGGDTTIWDQVSFRLRGVTGEVHALETTSYVKRIQGSYMKWSPAPS